jgi:hypothetical protein
VWQPGHDRRALCSAYWTAEIGIGGFDEQQTISDDLARLGRVTAHEQMGKTPDAQTGVRSMDAQTKRRISG